MKRMISLIAGMALALLGGCAQPVRNVAIPGPQDRAAYQPQPYQKPLPPNAYGSPMGANPYGTHVPLPDEAAYVRAYQAQRQPRMMVVVLAPKHAKTYAAIHANKNDFDALGLSMIEYLNANGQIDIQNPAMAKKVLKREEFLRLQNGDPAVLPLLKAQLNTDVLVEIQASPTAQTSSGLPSVRLLAQAVSTTDARILGAVYVDMPLPMSKTHINIYTGYLADKIMQSLANVWGGGGRAINPLTVRIYNAAGVNDVLKIKHLIQKVPGVRLVVDRGITGSRTTAYGQLSVQYNGAPDDFYGALQQELGVSTGLKAVDLQNNTIDLEITGPMVLKTTTIKTTTRIRTETHTTVKTVHQNPIMPAK